MIPCSFGRGEVLLVPSVVRVLPRPPSRPVVVSLSSVDDSANRFVRLRAKRSAVHEPHAVIVPVIQRLK